MRRSSCWRSPHLLCPCAQSAQAARCVGFSIVLCLMAEYFAVCSSFSCTTEERDANGLKTSEATPCCGTHLLEAAREEYDAHSAGDMRCCNSASALQVAPDGRQQAGALTGETTRHLLVYHEGSMSDVTEAEVM